MGCIGNAWRYRYVMFNFHVKRNTLDQQHRENKIHHEEKCRPFQWISFPWGNFLPHPDKREHSAQNTRKPKKCRTGNKILTGVRNNSNEKKNQQLLSSAQPLFHLPTKDNQPNHIKNQMQDVIME